MNKVLPLFLLVCIRLIPSAIAGETDEPGKDSPQDEADYHFFVGANLRIPHVDTYFPVERIWNARAHIKVNDEIVVQRVRDIKEIKVDRQAKISSGFATISDLECDPEYSVGRDPRTIAARQQMVAQSMASEFSDEADSAIRHSANPSAFMDIPRVGLSTGTPESDMNELPASETSIAVSASSVLSALDVQQGLQIDNNLQIAQNFGFASNSGDIDTNPAHPRWDMLHIKFSISADQYYPSAHMVFIFQLADTEEGEPVMSWFHFLSLTDLSPEPKSYNYRLAAYPDGMYIASQEAFLFTNGTEIATNLSSKHVPMKTKDARVFLKYQYIAENSGKTRPPDRAWRYLDPSLKNRVTPEIRDQTLTLKIDEEGQVMDLQTSREVQRALRPQGIHEIASLMYLPALENGKPVAGELTFALKDVILN